MLGSALVLISFSFSITGLIFGNRNLFFKHYYVLLGDTTIGVNNYTRFNILKEKLQVINLTDIKYVFYPKIDKRSYLVLKNKKYIPLLNELEDYDLLISNLERKKIPVIERAQNFHENLLIIKMNIKKIILVLIVIIFFSVYNLVEHNTTRTYYYDINNPESYFNMDESPRDLNGSEYYELSERELLQGDYDLALDFITKAINLEPNEAR